MSASNGSSPACDHRLGWAGEEAPARGHGRCPDPVRRSLRQADRRSRVGILGSRGIRSGGLNPGRIGSGRVKSSIAAATPFVTVDCTSGQVSPTDQPSPNGTTIGPVTGVIQPNGAPAITVATDATPATELGVADMTPGSGAAVKAGDTLTVNYCGVGLGGKALFDSSYSRGTPATFPLDGVIAGWQQGLVGMQEGGTRLLVIPGALAYGANPPGGSGIQPDETLIFVVELAKIG
jgi:peptidylprolyl isomerase